VLNTVGGGGLYKPVTVRALQIENAPAP